MPSSKTIQNKGTNKQNAACEKKKSSINFEAALWFYEDFLLLKQIRKGALKYLLNDGYKILMSF